MNAEPGIPPWEALEWILREAEAATGISWDDFFPFGIFFLGTFLDKVQGQVCVDHPGQPLLGVWDWGSREGIHAVEQIPPGKFCPGWFLSASRAATSDLQILLKFHGKVLEIPGSAGPASPCPLQPLPPIPMNKSLDFPHSREFPALGAVWAGQDGAAASIPHSLSLGSQHKSLSLLSAVCFPDFFLG